MKKLLKSTFLLIPLLLSACSTPNENNSEQSSTAPSSSEPITINTGVLRGHGAPSQDIGEANSLYVDEDTGLIYEKGVKVNASSSSAKRAVGANEAEWISTKTIAGEHFEEGSALGNIVRSSLLSTNVTLKFTLDITTTSQSSQSSMHVITYIAYNFGNVLQKQVTGQDDSFDASDTIGYSHYDKNNDRYTLYLKNGNEFVNRTSYIYSSNPGEYLIASNFVNRCISNHIEKSIGVPLADTFIHELDNFTLSNEVYYLDKVINTTSPAFDQMYGENNYFMTLSEFNFKVNSTGDALDYFQLKYEYGDKERTSVLSEVLKAELINFRSTTF